MKRFLCVLMCVIVLTTVLCVNVFAQIGDLPTGTDLSANAGWLLLTFEKDHNYGTDCPSILLREYGTDAIVGQYPSYPLFSGICFAFVSFGPSLEGKKVYVASGFTVDSSLNVTEYYKGNYSYIGYSQYGYDTGITLSVGSVFYYNCVSNANFSAKVVRSYDCVGKPSSVTSMQVDYFPVTSNYNAPWTLSAFTSNLPAFVDLRFANLSQVIYYKTRLNIVGAEGAMYTFDCNDDTYDGNFVNTGSTGYVFRNVTNITPDASCAIDTKTNYSNWANSYWSTFEITGGPAPFEPGDPFTDDFGYYFVVFASTSDSSQYDVPKITFTDDNDSDHVVTLDAVKLPNFAYSSYWYYFTVFEYGPDWYDTTVTVSTDVPNQVGDLSRTYQYLNSESHWISSSRPAGVQLSAGVIFYDVYVPSDDTEILVGVVNVFQAEDFNYNVTSKQLNYYEFVGSSFNRRISLPESMNGLSFDMQKSTLLNRYSFGIQLETSIESEYSFECSDSSVDGLFVYNNGYYYYPSDSVSSRSNTFYPYTGYFTYSVQGPSFAQPWIKFHTDVFGHMFEYFEGLSNVYYVPFAFIVGMLSLCAVIIVGVCIIRRFKL